MGIKTGFTTSAGPCLASYIKAKNGRCFIIIVLNCEKMSMRFKDTEKLKKWVYYREGITKKVSTVRESSTAK
jgi:D-alanyl-D-alanine carboxypeptidase